MSKQHHEIQGLADIPSLWLSSALKAMQAAAVQTVSVEAIKTHENLQPRNAHLVPYKDKGRMEALSEEHWQMLALALASSSDVELEPVWLADVPPAPENGGKFGLYIVDGHHRFKAYRCALRTTIPARILALDFATAVLLSKPVNCSGCKLAMHREQRLDATWQYLAAVTNQGTTTLSQVGESLRLVAGRFGVGHNTVSRMLHELPSVNLADFRPEACDPGTGWPRWKFIRTPKSIWQTPLEVLPEDARVAREADVLARKIADLMENSSHEARALALKLLADESVATPDPMEAVKFLGEAVRPYGTWPEYVLSHWDTKLAQKVAPLFQNC